MADFEKKSFVLYHNFANQFYMLSMEQRGRLITAIFEHEIHGAPTNPLKGSAAMAYSFIKDVLERDHAEYMAVCERNAQNGKKGGRPKKESGEYEHKNTDKNPKKPKKADNDNDNENYNDIYIDNGNDNDNENENGNENDGGFSKPTEETLRLNSDAPHHAPLTNKDINNLCCMGVSLSYIKKMQEVAQIEAERTQKTVYDILLLWWKTGNTSS